MSARPNILIIMTDQQRGDTVLPDFPAEIPHLRKLTEGGTTFSRAYCPTPHCCPSRASFFTGQYPSEHGIWNNVLNRQALNIALPKGTRLWSQDLSEAGYDCHFFGKWHACGETRPSDHCWTEHQVGALPRQQHGYQWNDYERFSGEVPVYSEAEAIKVPLPGYGPDFTLGFVRDAADRNADERVTDEACELIQDLTDKGKPWCTYIGYQGPHDPYNPPKEYLDRVSIDSVELPENYGDEMADKPGLYRRMKRVFQGLNDDEARRAIQLYYAHICWLDDQIGRLLNSLGSELDNTVIVFCSDHGDYLGEHGLWLKGIPGFLSGYHVPLVIHWPDGFGQGGRTVEDIASIMDIGPTILESAGVAIPDSVSGRSLLPILEGNTPEDWRSSLLTQCNGVEQYVTQRGVITADWHYVYNAFDEDELYQLSSDSGEVENLVADPKYEERLKAMSAEMWRLALQVDDALAETSYATTAFAPSGPMSAFD